MDLRALVSKHYRDQLNPEDLLDIKINARVLYIFR